MTDNPRGSSPAGQDVDDEDLVVGDHDIIVDAVALTARDVGLLLLGKDDAAAFPPSSDRVRGVREAKLCTALKRRSWGATLQKGRLDPSGNAQDGPFKPNQTGCWLTVPAQT